MQVDELITVNCGRDEKTVEERFDLSFESAEGFEQKGCWLVRSRVQKQLLGKLLQEGHILDYDNH